MVLNITLFNFLIAFLILSIISLCYFHITLSLWFSQVINNILTFFSYFSPCLWGHTQIWTYIDVYIFGLFHNNVIRLYTFSYLKIHFKKSLQINWYRWNWIFYKIFIYLFACAGLSCHTRDLQLRHMGSSFQTRHGVWI